MAEPVQDGEPDPGTAAHPAQFVERMNELRMWAGRPSLRRIQVLAGKTRSLSGEEIDALPATTASYLLTGKTLPRLPKMAHVESFVGACLAACGRPAGEIEDRRRRWTSAWRALAQGNDADPSAPASGVSAPRQLPRDIAEFTGRAAELRRLDAITVANAGGAPTIVAIEGMAGVGKTRLAVHAAHRLVDQDRYTDIQLFADLHGFDSARPPADPSTVLGTFLRLLEVAGPRIPEDLDARAALYRDRLAGRRALIVLDDAATEDQVEPLLPGGAGCLVLITTRHHLGALAGVATLPLDVFTAPDAAELVARVAGPERVAAEPADAARLARLCGHLPIAVALAARRLRDRPDWTLADLTARPVGPQPLLPQAIRATFDLSFQALQPTCRRVLRLLGVHPCDELTAASVAALAGLPPSEAGTALDTLVDEHLLQPATPGRYRMHQLVREYARDRARTEEPAAERHLAVAGLIRHYLALARGATLLVHPTESRRLAPEEATTFDRPFATVAEAVAWAGTDLANLMAIVEHVAADRELPDLVGNLAVRLVLALYRPLTNGGHSRERIRLNELAAAIASRTGDRAGQAQALEDLGTLCGLVGRCAEAITHNERALDIWRQLGIGVGEQGCLVGLGISYRQLGRLDDSIACLEQARTISRELSYRPGETSALNQLGLTYQAMGRFDRAIDCQLRSAIVCQQLRNRLGEAIALANLGWAYQRSGRPAEAIPHHQRGLNLFRDLNDRYNEAEQLWALAQAHHRLDHHDQARELWHRSIGELEDLRLLDPADAAALLAQPVPETPEIIRLNT